MKCGFCGREVDKGTTECPYCHYRFTLDTQVLSPEERDTFEGVTIDESTGTDESNAQSVSSYGEREQYEERLRQQAAQSGVKVHTFGCGSGLLMTLLILCGILAVIFFLLPTFLIFAAVGAVVVFVLRLFMGA